MSAAHPSLFNRLVDDAAVFPPGNAPVPIAWSEHVALRAGRYGDLLGPLLIGTVDASSLLDAAVGGPARPDPQTAAGLRPERVEVAVIARPGTPVEDLLDAVATLRTSPRLHVASVEVAHDEEGRWRSALEVGASVAVEVPREPSAQNRALDDVAHAAADGMQRVVAKLRTQSTPASAVPSPRELAVFLHGAGERDLPFKLTGGMHHVTFHTESLPDGRSEDQHGVLNVLVATHRLEQGASVSDLAAALELRDADALASVARGLQEQDVDRVRARFMSFGCCGVMDPIGELEDLGLLTA